MQIDRTLADAIQRRPWVYKIILLSMLMVCIFGLMQVSRIHAAQSAPNKIIILDVEGVIDPIVAKYVQRNLEMVQSSDTALVIIRLDTPGGLDTAMREVVQTILNAEVPVAVFVAPSGARAASAGVFITMAAHIAAMAPGTNIGAAHPVALGEGEMSETMVDKVTNDAVAYLQAIAQERGRNGEWGEAAVRESASLAANDAQTENVIDFVATDLTDLLTQLEGHQVSLAQKELTLTLAEAMIEEHPMSWLEIIAHGIIDPNIAYILLSLGTIALIAEFYNPGTFIPGVTGLIALLLAFVALGNLPVNWGGTALIGLAFILFLIDLNIAGFSLSIAGVISFVLGSLLLFSPFDPNMPTMPRLSVDPWLLVGMTTLLVIFFGFALTAGLKAQKQASLMVPKLPLGTIGTAQSTLDPLGVVQIQSETWTATAIEPVAAGEKVEVVGGEGLCLQVRRIIEEINEDKM